jgi:hypothetical protein
MKLCHLYSWILGLILPLCLLFQAGRVFGVTEISLDDGLAASTPTPFLKQIYPDTAKKAQAVSTPVPVAEPQKKEITIEDVSDESVDSEEEEEEPTPTPNIVQGKKKFK